MINKKSSTPLYVQIKNWLTTQIARGELKAGDQVPSESEIAELHNVSRMTARKALDELTHQRVLYRRKGKGTYVAEQVMSYGLSTMQSFSRTLQQQGYTVQTRVLHQELIPPPLAVSEVLQLQPTEPAIIIQRLRLVEGKPAAIHTSYLSARLFRPLLDMNLEKASLLESIERISGIAIGYTRDAFEASLANFEDAELLNIEMNSPVLRFEGAAYSENGRPLRYTRGVYPGVLFKFVLTHTAQQGVSINVESLLKSS